MLYQIGGVGTDSVPVVKLKGEREGVGFGRGTD